MAHQRRPGEGMQCSAFCKKLKKKHPTGGSFGGFPMMGKMENLKLRKSAANALLSLALLS